MTLREAVDANPAAWRDILACQPGATVRDASVLTGVECALCNSIFFPRWSADEADARIDALLAEGAERGVRRLWWLGEAAQPADLVDRLEERGAVVDGEELPGMILADLGSRLPAQLDAGLDIARVAGARDLDAFAVPFGAAYALPADGLAAVVAAFGAYGLDGDVRHYVGRRDGRPVATASVVVRDGVAGLYDVGTLPSERGRGFGLALTVAALRGAVEAGATGAILHSSPDGIGIYRRLGFETVCRVQVVETR